VPERSQISPVARRYDVNVSSEAIIKEKSVNYVIVIGADAVAKQYGIEAMPVTLLIDQEGQNRGDTHGTSRQGGVSPRNRRAPGK
jgi:hypothetical protein